MSENRSEPKASNYIIRISTSKWSWVLIGDFLEIELKDHFALRQRMNKVRGFDATLSDLNFDWVIKNVIFEVISSTLMQIVLQTSHKESSRNLFNFFSEQTRTVIKHELVIKERKFFEVCARLPHSEASYTDPSLLPSSFHPTTFPLSHQLLSFNQGHCDLNSKSIKNSESGSLIMHS